MTIKKIFLPALFIISATVFGQEEKVDVKAKPFFGLKAGVNAIKLSQHEDKTLSFGLQIGTTYTIPMSKRFFFQPELLLQTTNYSSKFSVVFFNGSRVQEQSTKSTLLLVPLNFKYALSKKVDIDLGPAISFTLNSDEKVVVTENIGGMVQVFEFDPDNDPYATNDTKLGFAANLGINYNVTENVYLGLRYSLFIANYQTLDRTIDSSLFALSVGYSFK